MNGRLRKREGHQPPMSDLTLDSPAVDQEVAAPAATNLETPKTPTQVPVESHKERRESMLEALSFRIEIFQNIYEDIKRIEPGLNEEETRATFDLLRYRWLATFSDETLENVKLMEDIDNYDTDLGARQAEEVRKRLVKDQDVQTAITINDLVDTLFLKYTEVSNYRESEYALYQAIEDFLERNELSRDDLVSTELGATDVTLTFRNGTVFPGMESAVGFHEANRVFIVASDTGDKTIDTIEHERVHNLIDGLPTINNRTLTPIKIAQEITQQKRESSSSRGQVDYRSTFTEIWQAPTRNLDAIELIDGLQEEILAELKIAERNDFGREDGRAYYDSELADADLATAQNNALDLLEYIDQQLEDPELSDLHEELRTVSNRFTSLWNTMVQNLEESTSVAKSIGTDATQFVHMAVVALKPSQYRHILTLMEHKFGKEKISANKKIEDITFFSVLGYKKLEKFLKARGGELNEKEKEHLRMATEYGLIMTESYTEKEDVQEMIDLANKTRVSLGLPRLENRFILSVWEGFIDSNLGAMIEGEEPFDPEQLDIRFRGVKERLNAILETRIDLEISYESPDVETLSDLRHKPVWKIVEHYGMQEEAEEYFNAKQDRKKKDAA
ncbi:hypothetical protein HQ524_01230 [Candidatus Uhrbacteria bacterium]|nr:hypothetical protein [Candidatus Uhrbacteria bacterium]